MKKLIYISSSQFPSKKANSVQVIKMCEQLGYSFKVTLFGIHNNEEPFDSTELYKYYGCSDSFKINLLKTKRNLIYSLIVFFKLFSKSADVYYSRNFLVCCLLAIIRKKNVVFEAHVDPIHQPYYSKIFKYFLRFLDLKVVAISGRLREIFIEYYNFNPRKVFVAHDAADEDKFKMKKNVITDSCRVQVGYIGSLYKGRGVELIYELAKCNPQIDFNIVGGSQSEVSDLKNLYNSSNFKFVGHVPYKDVPSYIQKQHILLAPYQRELQIAGKSNINTTDYMSPLKVFEYMASRRPIIISDLPILHEVLDNTSACLVSPEEIDQWQAALKRLVKEESYYNKLVDNAYERFKAKYTVRARVNEIIKFIKES